MTDTTLSREYGVTVTRRADGCDLHTAGYVRDLLTDLVGLLGEDNTLMDSLDRALSAGPADPHQPERHLPTEQAVADILAALNPASLAIRLDQPATQHLAKQLTVIAAQHKPTAVAA